MERTKMGSPEFRAKISGTSKRYWMSLSEEDKEKHRQKIKDSWTPERRQARRDMLKARFEDPEASAKYRENLSKGVRAANERPEVQEKRKIAAQISVSDPEIHRKMVKASNMPWNIEINKRIRGPLAHVTLDLKKGVISEEEADKRRADLYKTLEEIHDKYREEEIQYLIDHPSKNSRARKRQLEKIEKLKVGRKEKNNE